MANNNSNDLWTCETCNLDGLKGRFGSGRFSGQWYCDACWRTWKRPKLTSEVATSLPVMTYAEFQDQVKSGAKWLIIDGTIVDVAALTRSDQNVHKGGGDVLARAIGQDLTGYFVYYHANIPRTKSLHKPGLSHLEHVREKVAANAVGVLDSHKDWPSLDSPDHRFWVESEEKEPYHDFSLSSLAAEGTDAGNCVATVLAGIPPNSARARAFWAVVGSLVADAAAQPSHWNYKLTYFHDTLHRRGRWENPEFLRPSMNTYYHIPMGAQSCYGDQALEVLRSLVNCEGLDPSDVERRFAARFAEGTDYGPLPQDGLYNGNKQHVRDLPIKGPWRHISIAGFLRNLQDGRHWPECGTGDAQADCFVRIVPVVALYAGQPDLLERVAEAVRVTQNNPPSIVVGQAFARILENIIVYGLSGFYSLSKAVQEFSDLKRCHLMEGFYGRVANTMSGSMDKCKHSMQDVVFDIGGGSYSTSAVS